jgi:hypothetical protein
LTWAMETQPSGAGVGAAPSGEARYGTPCGNGL